MASGKKNYFRHSFQARNDEKIARLITKYGKEAYFHFFALVEVCAEIASEKFPDDGWFHFHPRTLCDALLVKKWTLVSHLSAIHQSGLCGVSVEPQSVISDRTVELQRVSVQLPKLAKYLGRYETNSPNKRKEKEIKVNEIKDTEKSSQEFVVCKEITPELFEGVIDEPKKNLPKQKPKRNRKKLENSPLSVLFSDKGDPIHEWLKDGREEIQNFILNMESHHVLAEEIRKAYFWQLTRKKRKADSFIVTWLKNRNKSHYGANANVSDDEHARIAAEFYKSKFGVYPEGYMVNDQVGA